MRDHGTTHSTQDTLASGMSVQTCTRTAGALYLIVIVIGILGEALIRGKLVVYGDPAATAANIAGSEMLWRVGLAAQLVLLMCAVTMTGIWYMLFRSINKPVALLMVLFALTSLAVESVGALYLHMALVPISGAQALSAMGVAQLQAQTYLAIAAHGNAFGIALVFFGVTCLMVGYLIRKSGFIPAWVGVLMQIAGLCYLINSFARILSPSLAGMLFPAILAPALIGEGAFCLWMLFKGVDLAAWQRKGAALI